MNVSTQPIPNPPTATESRFILAQVSNQTLAIPTVWVAEILRVEKIKILSLPFYNDLILGVTHHNGQVLPLLSTHLLLGQQQVELREISTVVKLGSVAGNVVKVGLVVDQVIRSAMQSELSKTAVVFDPQMIPVGLWQPLN